MIPKETLKKFLHSPPLWEKIISPSWPFSHFTLRRNLSQFHFPEKMNTSEHETLLEILKQTLMKNFPRENTFFFKTQDLSSIEKEVIHTHFFIKDSSSPRHETQAFLLNSNRQIYAKIDQEDHLLLGCFETTSHWDTALTHLFNLEKRIEKEHPFAFMPQFGYLTADPTQCGTALTIQGFLHLPCLIHLNKIDKISEKSQEEGLIFKGLSHFNTFVGDLIVIENQYTLGLSEQHILDTLHKTAIKLTCLEKNEREKLKQTPSPFLIDKISRALGLALHAHRMDIYETLNILSLLKLGTHLNWIKGITDRELNQIFFHSSHSYFFTESEKPLPPEDLLIKRANYLNKQCKKIELKIQ